MPSVAQPRSHAGLHDLPQVAQVRPTCAAVRPRAFSFSSMIPEMGSPLRWAWASSSPAVENG
jgi:hypothetical protein